MAMASDATRQTSRLPPAARGPNPNTYPMPAPETKAPPSNTHQPGSQGQITFLAYDTCSSKVG